jgi:hypothetical protein
VWSLPELQELFDEWVLCWQARPHEGLRHPFNPDQAASPNDAYAALVAAAGCIEQHLPRAIRHRADEVNKRAAELAGRGENPLLLDEPNAIHGLHRYWRSAFVDVISDDLIDVVVDQASRFSSPLSALLFFYVHGAATRIPGRRHCLFGTPSDVGFRRHRAVVRAHRVRRAHGVGAHGVGCVRPAPRRRKRVHQPPLR